MSRAGSDLVAAAAVVLAMLSALDASAARRRPAREPAPQRYLVPEEAVGVRLIIRQEPRENSPRVGEIPRSARGVVASGRRHRARRVLWHEVQYRGVRGWVNTPTLQPRARRAVAVAEPVEGDPGVFVEDLVCWGRAPDWKLVIDRDGSVACNATGSCSLSSRLRALPARPDPRRKATWRMEIRDQEDGTVMNVSLRYTGQCQNGVSGELFAYRITTYSADGIDQIGCCNRVDRAPAAAVSPL
jgi:hypothetical protein